MKKRQLKISIITLFPEFIDQYSSFGIIARAIKNKLVRIISVDLRQFGVDKRKTVDNPPFGGGLGMLLRADVLIKAIKKTSLSSSGKRSATRGSTKKKTRVILVTPQGKLFTQSHAKRLAKYDHLVFVSGRYEGFDERVTKFVDEEISVGDYILMGGELPALVMSETILRLIPGVLGKEASADNESFSTNLLEYPQYTKPEVLEVDGKKMRVPKVLLSGHHANIDAWRHEQAIKKTQKNRPDLLK